jgi:hypothetical protein
MPFTLLFRGVRSLPHPSLALFPPPSLSLCLSVSLSLFLSLFLLHSGRLQHQLGSACRLHVVCSDRRVGPHAFYLSGILFRRLVDGHADESEQGHVVRVRSCCALCAYAFMLVSLKSTYSVHVRVLSCLLDTHTHTHTHCYISSVATPF